MNPTTFLSACPQNSQAQLEKVRDRTDCSRQTAPYHFMTTGLKWDCHRSQSGQCISPPFTTTRETKKLSSSWLHFFFCREIKANLIRTLSSSRLYIQICLCVHLCCVQSNRTQPPFLPESKKVQLYFPDSMAVRIPIQVCSASW